MKTYFSIFLIVVFSVLSILHFYWALGGTWGLANSLPTTISGKRILNPTAIESTIVALGLIFFALYYLLKSGFVSDLLPPTFSSILGWVIPSIFLLRAMGDFKYIGFFKKITETPFAQNDSIFYSPLCLTIALIGYYLIKSNN